MISESRGGLAAGIEILTDPAFEKNSEGVRSRPNMRLIPFVVTVFGALGGHVRRGVLTKLAMHVVVCLKNKLRNNLLRLMQMECA
jgi:hypothetical protein